MHKLVQGAHMGPPGLMPQVIFCELPCNFTNNIHVSAKNSSAKGNCYIKKSSVNVRFDFEICSLKYAL